MLEKRSILVVDDDPILRSIVTRTLVDCGHSVYEARDGEDAFRVAHLPGGERIGLLITDLIMPGMDGRNLAQWMTGAYPGMKILFMSGFSEESENVASAIKAHTNATLLRKPFSPSELRQAVGELIGEGLRVGEI